MTIASIPIGIARPEERKSDTVEIRVARSRRSWALEIQDDDEARRVPIGERPVVFGSGRTADVRVRDRP